MPDNKLTHPTLVKEAVERIKAEIAFQEENPRGICATVRLDDLRTLLASLPTDDDDTVERACKAFAKASDYYVPFHRGLSSPSADKLRKGIRAAIHTLIGRDK